MEKTSSEKAVKMQKLRHAVERLRKSRAHRRYAESQNKSWLERLRERLGI